jgi:hypothetical protein
MTNIIDNRFVAAVSALAFSAVLMSIAIGPATSAAGFLA